MVQFHQQPLGVVAIGLYEDGVLLPDTVRAVTLAAAGDVASVSFNKKMGVCPRGMTSLSVQSVPSVIKPTDTRTPIIPQAPSILAATNNTPRNDN